ncbi:MAG: outer membrane protein [Salibacteraceae bacterium]|jgi:outer membrane protein
MKNYLGAIIIAVIGFGMTSCDAKTNEESSNPVKPVSTEVVEISEPGKKLQVIAMVNSDSILSQYEYALFLRDELTEKSIKFEGVLRQKESRLRTDMENLQRDAPTLTQFEGQNRQQKLIKEQENLQMKQEEYSRKLMVIEQDYNRDIHNAINEFLERYCADKPYEMVLSNSDLGIIRWADKSLDITDQVLAGLNEEYALRNTVAKSE